jgi:hypothetical protein
VTGDLNVRILDSQVRTTLTINNIFNRIINFARISLLSYSFLYDIIQYVFLYGCETWSLTLRDEHRQGVFENRVLRRIFGPKRDEVTGE